MEFCTCDKEIFGKGLVRKHFKRVYKEIGVAMLVLEFKKQIGEFIPRNVRRY